MSCYPFFELLATLQQNELLSVFSKTSCYPFLTNLLLSVFNKIWAAFRFSKMSYYPLLKIWAAIRFTKMSYYPFFKSELLSVCSKTSCFPFFFFFWRRAVLTTWRRPWWPIAYTLTSTQTLPQDPGQVNSGSRVESNRRPLTLQSGTQPMGPPDRPLLL